MIRKRQAKNQVSSLMRKYRRKLSIRTKIIGLTERPRVSVNRSNKNLFVQVVDDSQGRTLFSVQTFGKHAVGKGPTKESGRVVGAKVADMLKTKNIETVTFDRNGYRYHGVVAAVADALREGGIKL